MRPTRFIRDQLAHGLSGLGLTDPRRSRDRLTIVTFHRVLPAELRRQYPYPGLVVTPEELDWFVMYFAKHFECGALAATHRKWIEGGAMDKPLLAITFDDGQLDNYEHAIPVLEKRGVRASFFIPIESLDSGELLWHDRLGFGITRAMARGHEGVLRELLEHRGIASRGAALEDAAVEGAKKLEPDQRRSLAERIEALGGGEPSPAWAAMMTWGQVRELAAAGHEIGSHSMSHTLMPQCTDEELAWEVGESRRVLESNIDAPIETFCYPNGDADERTAAAVEHAGYQRAVTTRWGRNRQQAPTFLLRRCDMDARRTVGAGGSLSEAHVAFRMSGLHPGLRD